MSQILILCGLKSRWFWENTSLLSVFKFGKEHASLAFFDGILNNYFKQPCSDVDEVTNLALVVELGH